VHQSGTCKTCSTTASSPTLSLLAMVSHYLDTFH